MEHTGYVKRHEAEKFSDEKEEAGVAWDAKRCQRAHVALLQQMRDAVEAWVHARNDTKAARFLNRSAAGLRARAARAERRLSAGEMPPARASTGAGHHMVGDESHSAWVDAKMWLKRARALVAAEIAADSLGKQALAHRAGARALLMSERKRWVDQQRRLAASLDDQCEAMEKETSSLKVEIHQLEKSRRV